MKLLKFPRMPWARLREWRDEVKRKHAEANKLVQSRQVRRRRYFQTAFASVSKEIGGEPRSNRRRIASRVAKKTWMGRPQPQLPRAA